MLRNHIVEIINKKLAYSPTKSQSVLIEKLSDFVASNDKQLFVITGYAGTGKTTLIGSFVKTLQELRLRSVLMAPTGRAAKVLSNYAGRAAFTIHKMIYRQKSSKDGFGDFSIRKNLKTATFYIVDEASMISNVKSDFSVFGSGDLLSDLIKFVYSGKNCKLILIGDDAQLPPVGLENSPALNKSVIEGFGIDIVDVNLNEVVRQSEDSGILMNATKIRSMINKSSFTFPKIKTEGFKDVIRINGAELIEELTESYEKYGINDTIVVSRSNKRANRYNNGIRNQILWREEEISVGDLLMVVKNNYFWIEEFEKLDFIANGDIVEITRIKKYQELYSRRFADVTVKFIDYDNYELDTKIMLDTLNIESAALPYEENKKLYYNILEDYSELKTKKEKYKQVKENEYFNALQVKFAYAVTCHKAQGGQWRSVFIDQGYITEEMINIEFLRWLYTAFTRPVERLYLVNFDKQFFEKD